MTESHCPHCQTELPEQRAGEALIACPACGRDLMDWEEDEALGSRALLFGGAAALLGIAVWAGVAIATGYEIGWLAWGLGALVGFAIMKGGGFGLKAGIAAGVLALVAIAGGRAASLYFYQEQALDEIWSSPESQADLASLKAESQDYLALRNAEDDGVLREFLEQHDYQTMTGSPEWTDEELAEVRAEMVPRWLMMAQDGGEVQYQKFWRSEVKAQFPLWKIFQMESGIQDILFLLLGVGTAFKLGMG